MFMHHTSGQFNVRMPQLSDVSICYRYRTTNSKGDSASVCGDYLSVCVVSVCQVSVLLYVYVYIRCTFSVYLSLCVVSVCVRYLCVCGVCVCAVSVPAGCCRRDPS